MHIIEVDDPLTLQQLIRETPNRSPGLHLSTVIKDMLKLQHPKTYGGEIRPEFIGLGSSIEDAFARVLRKLFDWEQPGEFRRDGIIHTPDGWNNDDGMLEELKVTWAKYRGPDTLFHPTFTRYHLQAKPYCGVTGQDRIRFRVLFVTGTGAPPFPMLKTFIVRYGRQELLDTRLQMRQHAEDRNLYARHRR